MKKIAPLIAFILAMVVLIVFCFIELNNYIKIIIALGALAIFIVTNLNSELGKNIRKSFNKDVGNSQSQDVSNTESQDVNKSQDVSK